MQKIKIPSEIIRRTGWRMTPDTGKQIGDAAGEIKTVLGVANNLAHYIIIHAFGQIKELPIYRHRVKQAFEQAIKEFEMYEWRLRHPNGKLSFFDLDKMDNETRAKYSESLTNEEYFDYWCGLASKAYDRTFPLFSCLAYKYEKVFGGLGYKNAKTSSWLYAAESAIEIAVALYNNAILGIEKRTGIPREVLIYIFGDFSLETVLVRWQFAIAQVIPTNHKITETESRNIELTLLQLTEIMGDGQLYNSSAKKQVKDYSEVFSSNKEKKKALATIKASSMS